MTLSQFIQTNKISLSAYRVESNPHMEDSQSMDHWRVTLKAGGRRMTLVFSMGIGHHGKTPKVADVLYCLASDASFIENAGGFEDYCSELGLDSDSRKAERSYMFTKRQTERLRRFIGDGAFDQLVWHVERM